MIAAIVGRWVESSTHLSPAEASVLIDTLRDIQGQDDPQAAIAALSEIPGQTSIDEAEVVDEPS